MGADADLPVARHRAVGERRRLAFLWSVVGVLAAGGVWVVSTPHPGDVLPGLGPTSTQPAAAAAPAGQAAQPLTEAQSFNAERYFPGQRAYESDLYKARRTAARDGADCKAVQNDKTRNVLEKLDCQGWLGIALTRNDQPVITSITVLRFTDPAAAARAVQAVREHAADFEFTFPDGLVAPAAGVKPMAAVRVDLVGHYLTLTVSRYADQRAGDRPDETLSASTRSAAAVAGQPFMWM
ncbi:hypothetical protein KCH_71900 [Kitasatospora cheerisanensis KCTC 2395]|uniref:Uncharacterized protein n=1 Tax=Kitasatospora cheerisanensis KCTC 2395 TaxID=1348663 RepID=A0A066YSN4_9ACTN|nr:hypothetical protein KCH_71900 [Kitasatospora cheerisanensis KCTC 2395]